MLARVQKVLTRARLFGAPNRAPLSSRLATPSGSVPLLGSAFYARHVAVALVSFAATGAYYITTGPKGLAEQPTIPTTPARPSRTALVVDEGNLYVGPIPDQFPIIKDTLERGRRILEMLTPEQATKKLRKNEESWLVERGEGVSRYDFVQIPSNDPIEDDRSDNFIHFPANASESASPGNDWMFWGIYDGHSGWATSATLRQQLIPFVAREINDTILSQRSSGIFNPPSEAIDQAIQRGFVRLDHEIVHKSVQKVLESKSKSVGAEVLAPALSGACALLSFYDRKNKLLRVACTGDSRAVLGRRQGDGKWQAIPLSEDQTGDTPSEIARLRAEHPNEPNVILHGRVLGGLQPTRAFGDSIYKWDVDTQKAMHRGYYGRAGRNGIKSPPYVTAEPVVTATRIEPAKGDFVIMATDGLWEMLTNEEAVGLVGKWLDAKERRFEPAQSWFGGLIGKSNKPLPVSPPTSPGGDNTVPVRPIQWGIARDREQSFVVEDKNAATHLARNAMGGSNEEQLCSLLTLTAPNSRRFRDDLTIQVIFFDDKTPDQGRVVLNPEASAPMRPKL